ncbi:nicotianamine synthase family protein [Desulfobacter curvatus]|uniref:nicotianamine synthase family protein n=1 Tax=Desulfobacter curvatus TaxID=2290 RepID=UPI00038036B3|nr:nicotianamine synthase family protein [Desulfobacter curvatus]
MTNLDLIKKEFLDIHAALAHVSPEGLLEGKHEDIYHCFGRLDRLAAMDIDDSQAETLRCDPEAAKILDRISRLKRANGLRMEIHNAKTVISSPSPCDTVKQFVYYPNYMELARMEYTGANLCPGDRVIFLGSGPMPLTLICLCIRYKIFGIGIEQFPEYARLSRHLIKVLGLEEQINIIEGSHSSLPLPEPCRLIMIGADALPKDEIFAHLSKHLEQGTALSYRIYEKGLRRLLDVQSNFKLPPGIKEVTRIRPHPPVNNTSVFTIIDHI